MSEDRTGMVCPECGADISRQTCEEHFHQMLAWENEYPELGEVHHLTVLCYYLQHPGLYSSSGLAYALRLLVDFVEGGISPGDARRRSRDEVSSRKRDWKITSRQGSRGSYARQPGWRLRAADVTAGGPERYRENARAWAATALAALREAKEIP